MCGAGHYGPAGPPPLTLPEAWSQKPPASGAMELGRGLLGRLETSQEDPQVFQSQGRPPEGPPPTCCGQPMVAWRVVPESSILYPCPWPRGRRKAEGMQESRPGPVPTGWGGSAGLPVGPRALWLGWSLSSPCKQQRHTEPPLCVHARVCACAGGLRAQGTHGLKPRMGALLVPLQLPSHAGPRWGSCLLTPVERLLCPSLVHS